MLSSILFQDLGEKAGHEGYIQTPDDLNDYSLEEEKLVGGEVEEDAFEVRYVYYLLIHNCFQEIFELCVSSIHISLSLSYHIM